MNRIPRKLSLRIASLTVAIVPAFAYAGAFQSGNDLVVEQVSTNSGASAVSLNEYSASGSTLTSTTAVNTINFATTGGSELTGANTANTNHDQSLHLSSDGSILVLGGYRADVGATDPSLTTVDRVIGVVNSSGAVNTSTVVGGFAGETLRSVASDGTHFWVVGDNSVTSGNGGVRYVSGIGATSSIDVSSGADASVRDVNIFGGNLYGGSGSSSVAHAAFQIGSGLPNTAGSASNVLLNTDGQDASNVYLADLSSTVPGYDTLYVVGKTKFAKYSLTSNDGGNTFTVWTPNGSVTTPTQPEKLAARVDGNGIDFFIGTDAAIYGYTDTSGYNATLNGTLSSALLTAPTGEQFRGISFAPTPEPASLSLVALGGIALLRRRRA